MPETSAGALPRRSTACGIDYRKNMEGLFGAVDPRRDVAISNAARLLRHHEAIGNARPSTMNPATRVADILGELGPYLERDGD